MMLQRKARTLIKHYWRWLPLALILLLAALTVVSMLPFSPYYLYRMQTAVVSAWGVIVLPLAQPGSLVLVLLALVIIWIRTPANTAGRWIVAVYILLSLGCGFIYLIVAPILEPVLFNQPSRIILDTPHHDYFLDVRVSASDGVFYTLHECDTQRVLCRVVTFVTGDHPSPGYVLDRAPQVDVVLAPTDDGVQIVELGAVIYTHPADGEN